MAAPRTTATRRLARIVGCSSPAYRAPFAPARGRNESDPNDSPTFSRNQFMKTAPLILIAPSTDRKGVEFHDYSLSLSDAYPRAIQIAGGIPWVLSGTPAREVIAESVQRSDGVLLTGGDDVQTELYAPKVPQKLKKTVMQADPARDFTELALIQEIFRQQKPLLAICRGQQILNVAFGGDLIVDIPTQKPEALRHKRYDAKSRPVHEIALAPDSLLAELLGKQNIGVNSTHHQAVDNV